MRLGSTAGYGSLLTWGVPRRSVGHPCLPHFSRWGQWPRRIFGRMQGAMGNWKAHRPVPDPIKDGFGSQTGRGGWACGNLGRLRLAKLPETLRVAAFCSASKLVSLHMHVHPLDSVTSCALRKGAGDGEGVVDGDGSWWWSRFSKTQPLANGRPSLIQFMYCTNITIRFIRLQNPAFWNTHFYASQSILVPQQHYMLPELIFTLVLMQAPDV